MDPYHSDTKIEDLPKMAGCALSDVEWRFDNVGGNIVFKKKCCKKYKRKGEHCKSCPKR